MDNKLVVLVVDDEPGIRSGIRRVLLNYTVGFPFMDEDFGFDVIEAATGEDGMDLIERETIDIIMLDNKLPGIQGIDMLEKINRMNLDAMVMMITSYASLDLAVKATKNGAYNFVPKPFTPQELRSAVENLTKHLFLKRMTQRMNEEGKQIRFQFLSVLSHELKSPINAVEGYLRIMQEKQVGENVEDYMEMIERSLVRMSGMRNLIMDMLDLTRIESGKKKRVLKQVDLAEIATLAIHTMVPMAIQRNVKMILSTDKPFLVTADSEELEIILNNLISNAVKYNIDNGKVDVVLNRKKDKVEIKVIDTGIGIKEDDQEQLFQEFSRIKTSQTKHISGSGLGLSIVKKMVELYKGEIKLLSKPGLGTTVSVILPNI